MISKRKTPRPWAKRGMAGTDLLQGIPGAQPKKEFEKRKARAGRKEVSKNLERVDQDMVEQFLKKSGFAYLRIPDLANFYLFSQSSPCYNLIPRGHRAYLASYFAGLADTTVCLRLGNSPFLLCRAIEQKVRGRAMHHKQELRAAVFGTTVADTVEDFVRMVNELRDFRDKVAAALAQGGNEG